ncbi:MAG: scaffolding protein [Leptolyngbya sp. PLA2]|nr:scaffolding protein [Leptolyngbya sp.]MCE7971216.1 scaffolding protein [Leptolyngbya sp. PL-A2]MCQ3940895.1 scaffolding protein [cyanobacterium CYA1]MCZ7634067.1 NifU N-terminal domain-containing protein [Phycisphaerales bacterium]MDL1905209.1 scaffolding protein [Synechococcales cyanobacterium CNB]GIK19241.1 MAG: hypothetical protein BroJett004_14050 [Planctomycetota bacterium]
MPYRVLAFESTPNPNALKCLVEPCPADIPRSYRTSGEVSGDDALAQALFAVPGVTALLIHAAFITVTKSPGARWSAIRAGVERALHAAD